MKTEKASNTWDDLVFENRNKEYGAYSVRKSYSQHMTTGLGLSVALTCLLLILPRILNLISDGKSIIPAIVEIPVDLSNRLSQPPSFPEQSPPPARVRATPPANLPPQVVTTEPTEIIPTNEDITAALIEPSDGNGIVPTEASGTGVVEAPQEPDPNMIYYGGVSVMPEYKGGYREMMQYFSRKTKYPYSAQRLNIEGTVFVAFVINREGKVVDVKVIKGISADCDKEAIRVITSMTDWNPGRQNDRAVSVRMTLPIKFTLQH